MPAISFNLEFLDALLNVDKQQTTRKQTTRIKVGDTAQIYIEQRRRIIEKPLRRLTHSGQAARLNMANDERAHERTYYPNHDYAHFLGKVIITEVYAMLPLQNSSRSKWAKADGFPDFACADTWFTERYGEEWVNKWWTVIRWDGWAERYFEPEL